MKGWLSSKALAKLSVSSASKPSNSTFTKSEEPLALFNSTVGSEDYFEFDGFEFDEV